MSWQTKDEIKFLKHMANGKNAASKLQSWLRWSRRRYWDRGVDVEKCRAHAEVLLFKLGMQADE